MHMEDGQPSETAIQVASLRAFHFVCDGEPKILRDDLAMALAGFADEASLRGAMDEFKARLGTAMRKDKIETFVDRLRALVCLRARYAEDELADAVETGISQCVVLGAGLDSMAYRRQDLTNGLRVFELDHPASQAWKRKRLREIGVDIPSNLAFVPIDFARQTLRQSLRPPEFRWDVPTFFSWLGVTMYLAEATVISTLRDVAGMKKGSKIVFDYNDPPSDLSADLRRGGDALAAVVAKQREPFQSVFDPSALAVRLRELGFSAVHGLDAEEANRRYFVGRRDGLALPPSSVIPIVAARV